MEFYSSVGELFNVSQFIGADKRSFLYEMMEEYLVKNEGYPGQVIMLICDHGGDDQDIFDCLSDAMAALCPPGYYFAESRHDSGMFGFWPVPILDNWEVPS